MPPSGAGYKVDIPRISAGIAVRAASAAVRAEAAGFVHMALTAFRALWPDESQ